MSEPADVDGRIPDVSGLEADVVAASPELSVGDVCDCATDVLTFSVRSLGMLGKEDNISKTE